MGNDVAMMNRSPRRDAAERVYARLAPIYDLLYGVMLQPGRRRAMARLEPRAGDLILEVGVGTGFGLADYPVGAQVVAIDLSSQMLERAGRRLTRRKIDRVSLCRMDATHLAFDDSTFDAVYAPYVINVVPDPAAVAREMIRVCQPGGRIVLLNHFEGATGTDHSLGRLVGRMASRITGVDWRLDFETFFHASGLQPVSIEAVNIPRVSSVVVCRKP